MVVTLLQLKTQRLGALSHARSVFIQEARNAAWNRHVQRYYQAQPGFRQRLLQSSTPTQG